MAELKDIIAYILKEYPIKEELSNARLTKLIYLADWRNSIKNRKQISNINWYYDNYGPFVWDVKNEIEKNDNIFKVSSTSNIYGSPKTVFSLNKDKKDEVAISLSESLSEQERDSIDHVISVTKKLNWNDFIKLIYSTHPIVSSSRYSYLDLVKKAEEYEEAESA